MFTFDKSLFINRPPQEVFDFLTNPATFAQWEGSTESSEWTSEGPPGVGSTRRSVHRFLGRKIEGIDEFTIWDPPHRYGIKCVMGPISLQGKIKLESQGNGTQLAETIQVESGGFFKIAERLIGRQIETQFDTNLATVKRMLEASRV